MTDMDNPFTSFPVRSVSRGRTTTDWSFDTPSLNGTNASNHRRSDGSSHKTPDPLEYLTKGSLSYSGYLICISFVSLLSMLNGELKIIYLFTSKNNLTR